jgi:hypothetical protein
MDFFPKVGSDSKMIIVYNPILKNVPTPLNWLNIALIYLLHNTIIYILFNIQACWWSSKMAAFDKRAGRGCAAWFALKQ